MTCGPLFETSGGHSYVNRYHYLPSYSLMSDSASKHIPSPSTGAQIWRWVRDYWHWPVLAGVTLYIVFQFWQPLLELDPPGEEAPVFSHQTIEGTTFDTEAYSDHVLVVNVWATWCPPCRIELPGFVDLQEEWEGSVQFVGIAIDQQGADVVQPFADDKGLNYPQIASMQLAARHFPGEAVPRTYVIDRNGDIRYTHTGFLPKSTLNRVLRRLA